MLKQTGVEGSGCLSYVGVITILTVHLIHYTTLLERVSSVFDTGQLLPKGVGGFMVHLAVVPLENSG